MQFSESRQLKCMLLLQWNLKKQKHLQNCSLTFKQNLDPLEDEHKHKISMMKMQEKCVFLFKSSI